MEHPERRHTSNLYPSARHTGNPAWTGTPHKRNTGRGAYQLFRRSSACNSPSLLSSVKANGTTISARRSYCSVVIHFACCHTKFAVVSRSIQGQLVPCRPWKNTPCLHTTCPLALHYALRAAKLCFSSRVWKLSSIAFDRHLDRLTLMAKRPRASQSAGV